MLSEPTLEPRDEQHYIAIRVRVAMNEIGTVVPPLPGEVFGWLDKHGVQPAGPPFFRYLVIDMERELVIEAGVPVGTRVAGDEHFRAGSFPSGIYVTAVHTGHPDQLEGATAQLLEWAEANDITWQVTETPEGEAWRGRTEFYLDDPDVEPNMDNWRTELAFLTAIEPGVARGSFHP
jgi:effector-binding domain-containing protein